MAYNKIFIVAVAGVIGACAAIGCVHENPGPTFDNSFWNVTADAISNVEIQWQYGGKLYVQHPGRVEAAVYHLVGSAMAETPGPIPERAHVTWQTADGKSHEQTVEVAGKIPDIAHFNGSIFYKFSDNGVTVVPVTYEYQEANVRAGRAAVP